MLGPLRCRLERVLIVEHVFLHVEIVGGGPSERDEAVAVVRIRTIASALAPTRT